ncbi:MAG: transporter, partial [candidate division KSB1 bacterium]|nr:transporter [candidate division KSB1 bacterium]
SSLVCKRDLKWTRGFLYWRKLMRHARFDFHSCKKLLAVQVVCAFHVFVCAESALSQVNSGRGPMIVRAAWPLQSGYLTFYLHARFFSKVVNVDLGPLGLDAFAFWDVHGGIALNYGLGSHWDAALSAVAYQDHQQGGKGYTLFKDLLFTLKTGNIGSKNSPWRFGFDLGVRYPIAQMQNVVLEPYGSRKVGFGTTGLLSYARDPMAPENRLNAHLNFGYWNHNDTGQKLTQLPAKIDIFRVRKATQELVYGVAFVLPAEKFDFRLEAYGWQFLRKPPATAYSRENVFYISPGVSYRAYPWMKLEFSFDLRASKNSDETLYTTSASQPGVLQLNGLPNFPNWRVGLGVKLAILPTSLHRLSDQSLWSSKVQSRRELYERILREQKETAEAEIELQKIREQRRQSERELQRLRRLINGEPESDTTAPAQNTDQEKPTPPEQNDPHQEKAVEP